MHPRDNFPTSAFTGGSPGEGTIIAGCTLMHPRDSYPTSAFPGGSPGEGTIIAPRATNFISGPTVFTIFANQRLNRTGGISEPTLTSHADATDLPPHEAWTTVFANMASIFITSWDFDDFGRDHMEFIEYGDTCYLNEQPPNNVITQVEDILSRRMGCTHVDVGVPLHLHVSPHHPHRCYSNECASADDGFMRTGTFCIHLRPFCLTKFSTFSPSYWEPNSYYPRGLICRKGNSSNFKIR